MNFIITALANQLMLIICLALIITLGILWRDLLSAVKQLNRLEEEEDLEEETQEQRKQITFTAIKNFSAKAEDKRK